MIEQPMIARRGALGLIGAGAGLAASGAPARAKRGRLDLDDPADRLTAYMLMRGALDDRLVIGCVTAHYFGVVDDAMTPLFGVVSATFARYRPRAGGGYDGVTVEIAYFTDPATGMAMTTFANPYTNETVAVPVTVMPAAPIVIAPDLTLSLGKSRPGFKVDHKVLPIQASGDDIWIPELTLTEAAIPGVDKPFRYSELVTLHTRRSDLDKPGIRRVRCETNFTNVVGWRPWLKMAGSPGHMMAVGSGRYGAMLDDMPPAWIAATRATRPAVLTNPSALLEPLWRDGESGK